MTRRINARLEPKLARKVDALRKQTGQSVTEIVKASLEAYFVAANRAGEPSELLADFIGCASGPGDLSRTYKTELAKSLTRKHRP
jgi:Ribbon-helix-helix protein, copG family